MTQAGHIEAVTGEGEDIDEGIAEFIVDERPLDASGEGLPDVADLLAHLVPGVGNVALRRVILENNEHQRFARSRIGAQDIDPGHFLQFFLDALGHLQFDLVRRRAGPQRAYDHDLEGEIRVFRPPQLQIRKHPAQDHDDDQIGHHRTVAQGPFREIEMGHLAAPGT